MLARGSANTPLVSRQRPIGVLIRPRGKDPTDRWRQSAAIGPLASSVLSPYNPEFYVSTAVCLGAQSTAPHPMFCATLSWLAATDQDCTLNVGAPDASLAYER